MCFCKFITYQEGIQHFLMREDPVRKQICIVLFRRQLECKSYVIALLIPKPYSSLFVLKIEFLYRKFMFTKVSVSWMGRTSIALHEIHNKIICIMFFNLQYQLKLISFKFLALHCIIDPKIRHSKESLLHLGFLT